MIVNNFSVPFDQLSVPTPFYVNFSGGSPAFPLIAIGRGSYIVSAQVQSTINFDVEAGIHNIQIGDFCSLADDVTFMVNMNHDYKSITTSPSSLLAPSSQKLLKISRKGQILLQNDVWVGHGVTIMSGVTVHNGAVIAANANVTKDVPPYAIVGGNPAQVIKYRFSSEQIADLLNISWWDWDTEKITNCKEDFQLPIDEFIFKHRNPRVVDIKKERHKEIYLFFADFTEPYPIWQKVIKAYCAEYGSDLKLRTRKYAIEP